MEVQSPAEEESFMKYLGGPYKSFLRCMTLKNGVIVVGVLDIIVGVLRFFEFFMILSEIFHAEFDAWAALALLLDIVSITVAVMAIPAVNGILKNSYLPLSIYAKIKKFELVFNVAWNFIVQVFLEGTDGVIGLFIVLFILFLINFYLAKIVWSADIRLKYNETILVLHGEEVVKLMNQQANTLAPRSGIIAMPGQPIYNAPVGQPV